MRSHHFSLSASQRLNSLRIPANGAIQVLITLLVLSLCLFFPSPATAASPHVYDVPQAGSPGSQTQTVGNGWDPNSTIDIYFDSTDVGLVDTDNNGSFGMALKAPTIRQNGLAIQIPKDAVPGQHWITAVERITQLQAQVAFTVWTDWPQSRFAPDHTAFNPYENILNPETVVNLTTLWKSGYSSDRASPAVVNGVAYVSSGDWLYALDAGTGAVRWRSWTGNGIDPSPAVANGVVYVASGWGLHTFDAHSGNPLWSNERFSIGSPATVANGAVYVTGNFDGNVYAFNADTGVLLWTYAIGGDIHTSPAVANGVVYVNADQALCALDASTGALLWKRSGNSYPLAVANGVVYRSGGYGVNAFDAATGALLWDYQGAENLVVTAPAVANGVVYIGSFDNNVYALNATTGALLWRYATDSLIQFSSPAVAHGVVYIGSWENLYALDASTGAFLWKYRPDGVPYSPVVVNGVVYVSCNSYLYAFGLPSQQMSDKFSPPERPDPARLTPNWSPLLTK